MEGTYKVTMNGQTVGTAAVTREGMYYHIACRCDVPNDNMFRLIMQFKDDQMDLGILVPQGKQFGLGIRVSGKVFGQRSPQFVIMPRRESFSSKLVRICPEEPFSYLFRLESAYLVKKTNAMYLGFQEEK